MIENKLEDVVRIGFLSTPDCNVTSEHPELERRLADLLERRKGPLTEAEEEFRIACRDMLRVGSFKPTGRSKPASEFLVRAAKEGQFPRINTAVDLNNYISLKYLVPISLWDSGKVDTDHWRFRVGNESESYKFNPSGQQLKLKDLITGFAVNGDEEIPVVSPVKDSEQTKTDGLTKQIHVAIYHPAHWLGEPQLNEIVGEFQELLEQISGTVTISSDL